MLITLAQWGGGAIRKRQEGESQASGEAVEIQALYSIYDHGERQLSS